MFSRNELVHAVIWPDGRKSSIALIDPDGIVVATLPVREPLRGSDLSRLIPDGYCVDWDNCAVVNLSGEPVVRTVGQFDTAVVTERAELGFEERMQRLERRERRREKREIELAAHNRELLRELAEHKSAVVDDEPPADVTPPPEPEPFGPVLPPDAKLSEPAPEEGKADA